MKRPLVIFACDLALVLIILSIPHPLTVGVAQLLFALVTAVLAAEILAALSGEPMDWGRLVHRGDYVAPEVLGRLRAAADAEADLEERLGAPRAKRPEPTRERARSATGALSKPWGDRP